MKRINLLILFALLLLSSSCGNSNRPSSRISETSNSRVVENPTMEKKPVSNCLTIESIELNEDETIVRCSYINDGADAAWVSTETFIRDRSNNKKFIINDVTGFPFAPNEYVFKSYNEKVVVTMKFPALPKDVVSIDLIDEEDNPEGFNFYGIKL